MIRNDILDPTEAVLVNCLNESIEALTPAELGIDLVWVDDVVSVLAAGSSGKDRARVDVTDAKRGEIRNNFERILEGELGSELKAICTS